MFDCKKLLLTYINVACISVNGAVEKVYNGNIKNNNCAISRKK